MSSKARTLVAPGRGSAFAPRRPARILARFLAATVVAALLAPAATYALDPATTTVVTSSASVLAGSPVTYTVRVTAPVGSPVPTGVVSVRDGAVQIGTCTLASGACTVTSSALAVGMHAITAAYPGDAAHDPSTSPIALQAVTSGVRAARTAATTATSGATSLAVSLPAGATTGDMLIAAVTATGGTGVTITATGWTKLAGSDISSGTLLRQGLYYRVRAAGDASTFTFTFSTAQKASAVIVAVAGANTAAAPRSAASAYPSATTFTLPAISFGTQLTGLALGFLGVGVGTSLGTVANGYTTLGSIAATGGKTATQTTLGAAQRLLADATSVTGATMTMGLAAVGLGQTVVVPAATATTVTRILTAPATATFGSASTWSVRVDPTTATGSVAFLVDGAASGTTCALVAGTCSANLPLAAGQRTVAARYVPTGTSLQASTSSNVSVAVNRAISSTTLTLLAPTTVRGAVATFRVAVSGGATSAAGTGTVRIVEAGQDIASCVLSAGTCDATTATLAVGAHVVSAAFDGDTNLEPGTSLTATQNVTRAASFTTLAISPASASYGSGVTLTATVTSAAGTPTGTVAFSDGTLPLTSCTLGDGGTAGTCSVVVRTLSIGAHSLVARYGGDTDRLDSSSATQAATIGKATSTIAILVAPVSATLGATVTIRASITTGDGSVATGTVSFTEGTTVLGSCSLGSGGTPGACSIPVSTFTVGDHLVGVSYGGDPVHAATATTYTQAVGRALTTTTVTSSLASSSYGASVTFTVAVTSDAGTPTGSVAISDGSTSLTTCPLVSGSCTYSTSGLSVGSHTINATYLGDASRAPGSGNVVQTVARAATTTTLAISGTLAFGSSVTITAIVDRTAATGSVYFQDGLNPLGACTLGSGGIAGRCTLVTSSLTVGVHSIVGTYFGDTNFNSSPSAASSVTIARAATAITLVKSGGTTYGSAVVFTATLDRTAATGTIAFSDGTTPIGSCTVGTLAPASCAITLTTLAVGAHSVTAAYNGDASFLPILSSVVSAPIARGASTTTVAVTLASAVIGDQIGFSATVSPATATGTVDFLDGVTWLGQCQLASGSCTFTGAFDAKGAKSVTANYGGDTNLASSASTAAAIVVRAPSSTTLTTDVVSSTYGQAVTLTGAVAVTDGGAPTGRIAFSDGTTGVGSCDLAGSATCSITVTSLSGGNRSLAARYTGDTDYAPSTGTAAFTVVEATSATTVTTSAASVTATTPVTFTIAVTTADGGFATGIVAVSDGTAPLTTCRLTAGACTVTTDQLSIGAHTINATYLGDQNHTGSTASVAQTVVAIPTTVVATANPASTTYGSPVTITATITPGAATGSVTFTESGTTYGSCSILASSPGTCSFTTSTLPVGTRSITVRYAGDVRYAASNASVSVVVAKAASTTTVATNNATSTFGSSVTFTATVTPSVATGTVSFSDGTTGIGSCTLVSGSNGVCTLATAALSTGIHSITARFVGSTNLAASTSLTLTQTVTAAPTSLTFTPSANPSTAGAGTATITISPAAAGGSVTVTDNGNPYTSCTLVSGTCTISLAALTLGSHSLVASYAGAANYGATSATLGQAVSIGFRSVATATAGSKAATSLGIAIPASVTSGDVLVAAVTITGTTTITPGAGWTRLGGDVTSGSVAQGVFWRAVTSGDIGTTTTFTFSTSVKSEIVMIAVGGAATSGPLAVASQLNPAATSISTPSLTLASSTRGMALIFGGIAGATAVSSVGSGFTVPTGGEASTSGGQVQTTTAGAYSAASSYASIGASSITMSLTTATVSIGHVVFIPQAVTP